MISMSKQSQRGVLDVLVDGILSKQVGDGERWEDGGYEELDLSATRGAAG